MLYKDFKHLLYLRSDVIPGGTTFHRYVAIMPHKNAITMQSQPCAVPRDVLVIKEEAEVRHGP